MVIAGLGAPQARFAWHAQHLEHRLVLRGRCNAWSIFIEVRGSPATIDHFGRRLALRGRRSTWSTSGSFCVVGAALGASPVRFAWQAQHLEHLRPVLRGRCSTWSTFIEVRRSPATIDYFGRRLLAWQAQHLEHLQLVLRARRSTWSTSGPFCVAGAALGPPS